MFVYRVEAAEILSVGSVAAVLMSCFGGSENDSVARREARAIGVNCSKGRGEFLSHNMKREDQQDATIRFLLLTSVSTLFRASLWPSSGEQRPCYCIWCVVLILLDVVGSGCGGRCVVGCEHCEGFCSTLYY